eukprot:CAMPEP_0182474046 /NCGR_PEP_ID=MMETSP1319-20130603/24964_1 /TAXON_ID=172717 /ORGANISM="Bolidomonas pacifica, Strain RCC208" /LENGTH=120 /DNA_ID=CAMNT_0024674903 /DNA_START=76 /DNA_END=434 /DNA_ORIENTATION=+
MECHYREIYRAGQTHRKQQHKATPKTPISPSSASHPTTQHLEDVPSALVQVPNAHHHAAPHGDEEEELRAPHPHVSKEVVQHVAYEAEEDPEADQGHAHLPARLLLLRLLAARRREVTLG